MSEAKQPSDDSPEAKDAARAFTPGSYALNAEQREYMLERFGVRYVRVQTGEPMFGNRRQRRDAGWR